MGFPISRRACLRWLALGSPAAAAGYGFGIEPRCLRVRRQRFSERPTVRFAFFTDLHYRGDDRLLRRALAVMRAARPEFILFGGDWVEESRHLDGALTGLRDLEIPVFGVPGNHDYWSGIDFQRVDTALRRTGGGWLVDAPAFAAGGKVLLCGHSCTRQPHLSPDAGRKSIALVHYPRWADRLRDRFDLVLAGHSHGGQVRLPFLGALVKPDGVGPYERGRYATSAGPLYVSAGIGTFFLNVRFLCPPEVVLGEI